jgi:hypothetical protein
MTEPIKTLKAGFSEKDFASVITEMPQRYYDAVCWAINYQIEALEEMTSPNAALNLGPLAQVCGGIYWLRSILTELSSKRNLIE